ncbi:MAG: nucleotidyl transferase AbiEii/AbiGii toxin family protein [Patescibacteria group bacterium]|nr:nucleotidyl transferase AbiEii/AbiGii toxin family protein [Patescibacteria group bacterium]
MDKTTAELLARKIKISEHYIVREEYEMLILKEIYESEFGVSLMFKGGTALRLAYHSARFSEDLDFNLIGIIDKKKFVKFLKGVGKKYPEIVEVITSEKYHTIFGLIKIKIEYFDRVFSIKIEISKRVGKYQKNIDYHDRVITSEVAPLTVLARVASLELILREKADAMKNRKVARDIFDYWFINQLLKKEVRVDFSDYDKTKVISELHKLLARPYWRIIDSWLE